MAKKWNDVVNNPEYQKLNASQKEAARNEYFEFVVKPNVPDEDLEKARSEFDSFSTPSASDKLSNVYKEGLTGLKDLGKAALRKTVETGIFGLDRANDLVQGAISVPEAVVGLADIPTGGRVGKALEEVGYKPNEAKQFLTEKFSDEQKAANQAVSDADGFIDKSIAAIQNPRSIVSAVTQSAPLMGAGGVVGRGAVALGANPVIAGAVGEGVISAGSAAEGTRQQTKDGLLTGKQSGLSVASGLGTALTSVFGGKLAQKLSIADIDTVIAGGVTEEVKKSLAKRLVLGGMSEGVFEEMPQSIQEQILSNIALDKPLTEGVDEAAAMGLLSGTAMGGGASALLSGKNKEPGKEDLAPASNAPVQESNGQLLTISQGGEFADDALAAQKQAEYDAAEAKLSEQKAEKFKTLPDKNLQNLRKTAQTLTPADVPMIDAEIERRANLGTLTRAAEIAQQVDPLATQPVVAPAIPVNNEAIDAADLLEAENVSDLPNDGVTNVVADPTQEEGNYVQGSLGDLPNQLAGRSDTGPIDNSTEASAQGSGSDQLNGNGIQGNDAIAILNGEDAVSRPFAQATDDFLPKMRSMTTDDKVKAQIDEELKLRGIANVDTVNTPAVRVDETEKGVHVGEKINKEWTAFSPESGTLNIPRSEMPQVKAEHRGAMVNFLNARGVDHTQETVSASSLKPTQQEFSEAKVKKASKYAGGDRSILVSSDNHVLDGHHQWLSKLNKGGDVDVIRLNAPIAQLLNDVKEFPSSTVESGATTIEPSEKSGQVKVSDDVDYSTMSYDKLQQAREEGRAKNKALDLAVIRKYAGDKLANEAKSWSQRSIDKWFEQNATAEIENESSAFKGVDVDKIDAYSQAFNNFDETSPQALGSSIALKMRDIDKPDFVGSPEFVTIRNALAYSKEQGWKESDVLDAMRERAESYAGRDAPELFERLFKTKPITSGNGKVTEALPVEASEQPAKASKPKTSKPAKPKTLLATLRDLGGIALTEKRDVTGEVKGFAPGGYNQVFKSNTTRSLKGLIESGDLDDYLPYNMRLESNGANDDAFDSTEAYDYLADKIRNGESVLPYAVEEEVKANQYYQEVEATAQDVLDDFAKNFNEDEINAELQIAGTNEREAFADVQVFKPDSESGDTGSGERGTAATETNASQQAEVDNKSANKTASIKDAEQDKSLLSDSKDNKSDLLGDNTTAKQAVADAERAKDAKRNSGNDNQDTFTLTGSNSEADQAAAAGAQDLFAAPKSETKPQNEVAKAAEALTAAGVRGKEKLDTIKDVREGKVTADEVADAYGEPATQKPKGNVDDFGEKLEGARKDMVRAMAKEYSDDELASLPLSKIWPITDVNLIENKTAAAIAWTAREEIPSKPRKPYALKVWVGKVKILRDIGRIVSKALEVNPELMLQKLKDAQLGQFKSKVALLEAIDRDAWKRIGKVEEYPNAYSYVDGVKQIKPMVRIDVDGVTTTYEASSVADVIDNVNEKLGKEKQEKRMAFEVRGSSKGGYFINKKGDKNYTKLKTFDSSKEAFEFLRNNYDEVVAAWDATKDRLNVKESDVRGKENRPRTGEDYRKGKDVSSEEFATTFGFRGIQFGEWVKQGGKDNDRQGALNAAYDALMDLANIVGVPPKAMSLEGTLGLSFGARGKGSAAAHFEPGNLVINLTKTQGAGTLAHEWFHALDNYFSRKRGGEKSMAEVKSQQAYREGNYITYKPEALYINKNYGNKGITKAELERYRKQSPNSKYWSEENWILDPKHPQGVRPEVEVRFADLVDALNTSPMKQRARSIDSVKEGTDGYWSRIIELGARAFENYVIHKMQLNGYDNDYLANVVRVDSFNRDSSRFPYLLDEEVAPVAEAFDNLFSEIQTKETDSGNVVMFSRSNANATPYRGMDKDKAQSIIDELQKSHKGIPKVKLVDHHSKLPISSNLIEEINGSEQLLIERLELVTQLPSEQNIQAALSVRINDVEGLYSNGEIWINTNAINSEERLREVFAHEAIGHMSVASMLNEVDKTLFPKLLTQVKTLNKAGNKYIRAIWDDVKESQPDIDDTAMAGEVLAFIAERGDQDVEMSPVVRSIWQRLIDGIKAFAKLVFNVEMTDVDVRDIVSMASRYAKGEDVVSLISSNNMYYSRNNREPSKESGDTFLTAALEFTARNEDLFENAPSDSKDIADIAKDMNTQFRVEPFGKSQTKLDGAEKAWEVFMPNYKYRSAVIYEKGNEVWINVSRLQSGENQGNEIYSLAAAYAYNNDKVFIGDPLGLTDKAFYRRAENMLSSALKYGTTKHIEPHVAQTDPDLYYSFDEKTKDFGESVRKINWKKGDDAHNIKELIYTVYHGAITNIPELKNVIFNPTTQGFTTIDGEQFTDKDFARVVSDYYARTDSGSGSRNDDGNTRSLGDNEPKKSNPYRAGVRTAKRAALFNTFLREKSGERRSEVLGSYVRELQNRGLADSLKGTFYSRSTSNPSQSSLTPKWDALENSTWSENLRRTLQDKNIDLKRVTQNIKAAGVNLADRWDAYLQEELYHGRAAKRVKDFLDNELNPLIEDMRARKVSIDDLQQYLWNRHAEERNIQIAKVNPDMKDGGSGITTQDAKDYLSALTPEDKSNYEALAARVYAINAGSRQTLVDYGLESAGTISTWNNTYKSYVPLKRDEMDLGFGMGTGQGFSVKGGAAKRAMGSSKQVVDIIANIAQQREQYIIRGEKNRVATALVGLAKTNPNEDFWEVDNPPRIRMIGKESGLVEEYTDPTYKNHPNVIVARILNKRGEVEERSVVFNKSNERAMQLSASMKNLDVDQMEGWLRDWVAPITRYFASVNTQYNPIFGTLNIIRDVQGALLNLSTTPIAGKQKGVLKLLTPALRGIYADTRTANGIKKPLQFFSYTQSQKQQAQAMRTLWEEFQREGGKTGYRDMFANAAERSEAIQKSIDPTWWAKTKLGKVVSANGLLTVPEEMIKDKTIKPIFDWLSDYNETLENSVRLAVYKVAVDNGQTKQQAASIAKNISVNFNRKGNMGQNLGALYAFFNASVQGTARIAETLTGKRGQQIVAGGLLFGAMQAVALMLAGFGDEEPREFVRDRNIIIPLGDKRYATIPMPLGYNAIPNLGRILTEWALSGFEKTNDRFTHILSMSAEVFNPIGGNGSIMSIVTPTALDPVNDLSQNKDWTNNQISREDINQNAQTAGFTRTKDKTWSGYVEIARFINKLTGGTEYTAGNISPTGDAIDYLVGQAFGGVGRELSKAGTTAEALLTGEELPPYKVPLVGRFYGDAKGQAAQSSEFYNNLRMLGKHETEIKGRRADNIGTQEYRKENPEAALIAHAKQSDKIVRNLRKLKESKVEAGAPASEVKAVDERITKQMQKLNELVRKKKEAVAQ